MSTIIPLLSTHRAADDSDDDDVSSDQAKEAFGALDDASKSLAFQWARVSPALRAKQGLASLRDATACMEQSLTESGWAAMLAQQRQQQQQDKEEKVRSRDPGAPAAGQQGRGAWREH